MEGSFRETVDGQYRFRDKNLIRYEWKTLSFLLTVEIWMKEFSDKSGLHAGGSIASVLLQDRTKGR